jgi:pilus assembly protein CpaB
VNILFHERSAATPPAETIPVIVAKAEIPRGAMISADMVKSCEFPKETVPAGAISRIDDAVDRVAFHSLVQAEPLLDTKLSPKHSKGGLAALVPPGMRAFTIQTQHVANQVAGFLLPGNKVDVLLTMNGQGPQDTTGGAVTTTLLQNVEILAVDQRLDAPLENRVDPKSLQSVTLLVTPEQAARLDLGQIKGTLHLSLRNPDDGNPAVTRPATLSGLQFSQEKSWSEQLIQVLEGVAKLRSTRAEDAAKPAKGSADASSPPTVLEIRTLRGTHHGVVPVELRGSRNER